MPDLQALLKGVLVVFAVSNVAIPLAIEDNRLAFLRSVWQRFTVLRFLASLGTFVVTLVTAIALSQIPGLSRGWASLIFGGTGGNIFLEPVTDGSGSTSVLIRLAVPVFLLTLLVVLPFLAKIEEEMFRKGGNDWRSIAKRSVVFGLVHCLVGVPLAAGIALILSGLFYGCVYKTAYDRCLREGADPSDAEKEGVMASTVAHTLYNLVAVLMLFSFAVQAV